MLLEALGVAVEPAREPEIGQGRQQGADEVGVAAVEEHRARGGVPELGRELRARETVI